MALHLLDLSQQDDPGVSLANSPRMLSILASTPLSLLNPPSEPHGAVSPLNTLSLLDAYLTKIISDTAQHHLHSNVKLPNRLDVHVFFELEGYYIHPFVSADYRPIDLDDIGYSLVGVHRPSRVTTSLSATPNPVHTPSTTGSTSASARYGDMLTRILTCLADVQRAGIDQMRQQHADHISTMDTLRSTIAPPSAKDIGDAVRDAVNDSVRTVVAPALGGIKFSTQST